MNALPLPRFVPTASVSRTRYVIPAQAGIPFFSVTQTAMGLPPSGSPSPESRSWATSQWQERQVSEPVGSFALMAFDPFRHVRTRLAAGMPHEMRAGGAVYRGTI
jgi:hypothetical protein